MFKIKKFNLLRFLLLLSIITILNCVITSEGTIREETLLPSEIVKIYIPVFRTRHNIYDPNIQVLLTDEIITSFNLDGSLVVTNSRNDADAILEGEIINYLRESIDFDENNLPVLYRIILEVRIRFINNRTGKELWTETEDNLQSITTYSERRVPIETEYIAQKRVVENLAQKVVNRTIRGWVN